MSKTAKTWITVIIIIVLIIAVWIIWGGNKAVIPAPTPTPTADLQGTSNNASSSDLVSSGLTTAMNDNSDTAVASDLATIDAEMVGLGEDSKSADSSINNPPSSPGDGLQ
ncbi:MAG: hypothetical protein WCV79_03435 [Candidatus Paceibacterota bacterium]|jgi:hypothetical protein